MFRFTFKQDETPDSLQEAIDNLFSELAGHEAYTEEYAAVTDQIVKLQKHQKESTTPWRPSADAVVGAAGSILGIILILHYEKVGVVTSKALGFVRSMK